MSRDTSRHYDRRELLALVGVGAGSIAGCLGDGDGGDGGNGNGNGDENGGGNGGETTLRVALNSEPTTLDVHESTRYPEHIVLSAIHEPLFYLNHDVEPEPHLLSDYEVNDDATEFVFEVEQGITFHDGSELDAETVVWNLERIVDVGVHAGAFEGVSSMEATGDYEATIQTDDPYPLFTRELSLFEMGMASREAVEDAGDDWGRNVIVGTGPYEFVEWEDADNIQLERYGDYDWGPDFVTKDQSNAEEVVVDIIPEEGTLANEITVGGVHASHELALGQSEMVEDHENADVERYQGTWTFLPLNTQKEPTDDVRVRRAIAHAVNREPLIEVGLDGEGELLKGFVPPHWGGALSEEENEELVPAYDPDAARAELEEAGWTNDEEGETRTKDGEELVLQHLSFPMGILENQAEAIQSMLADIGIETNLRVPEASTFYNDLENNEHHLVNSGGSFTPFASAVLAEYYHSDEAIVEGGRNYANYGNDEVDDLIATTQRDADADARDDAAREAQEILHEDVPVVGLNLLNRNYGYKTSLENIDTFVEHPLWWSEFHVHWREVDL